jgi:hypothetical protein
MCRSIRPLFNFEPPATDNEVRAAALQFVRKISGYQQPSQTNALAFNRAVDEIAASAQKLIDGMTTNFPARNREDEAAKARARFAARTFA